LDDGEGKTRSNGMFSPRVRLSLAMRLRRVSVAVGGTGVVGVMGAVDGVAGRRGSDKAIGTALRRRTSGRGSSFERRGLVEKDFGSGSDSELVCGVGRAREAADELEEEVYNELGVHGLDEDVAEKMDPCRRKDLGVLGRLVGPMGRSVMGMGVMGDSGSTRRGVLPRTLPSFLAERTRRAR